MEDQFGSDFITISDEDGTEYELEVLSTLEYNGSTYLAVVPAGDSLEQLQLEVSILKSVEEDGEPLLCAIEDEAELQAVYDLIMDALYEEEEEYSCFLPAWCVACLFGPTFFYREVRLHSWFADLPSAL